MCVCVWRFSSASPCVQISSVQSFLYHPTCTQRRQGVPSASGTCVASACVMGVCDGDEQWNEPQNNSYFLFFIFYLFFPLGALSEPMSDRSSPCMHPPMQAQAKLWAPGTQHITITVSDAWLPFPTTQDHRSQTLKT